MRIVNWNIERNAPSSWQAQSLLTEIKSIEPNLLCLTEAHETSCNALSGHSISAKGVAWSAQEASERKVVLWSLQPWTNVHMPKSLNEVGAAIVGDTQISGVAHRVIGLCIPYAMASPFGKEPKTKQWTQHTAFLEAFIAYLSIIDLSIPTIILGDFNRRIPFKGWGSKAAYELLLMSLNGFQVLTADMRDASDRLTVDHIAINFTAKDISVSFRTEMSENGKRRSDHFGVVVDVSK